MRDRRDKISVLEASRLSTLGFLRLRLGVWGLGFRVRVRVRVFSFEFRVSSFECGIRNFEFTIFQFRIGEPAFPTRVGPKDIRENPSIPSVNGAPNSCRRTREPINSSPGHQFSQNPPTFGWQVI